MAKQRKGQRPQRAPRTPRTPRPEAPAAPPATAAPRPVVASPARAPAFWFGFEVTWAKLALARVAIFTLLAIDAFLAIRHAPRYGAGDFNVGHAGFLSDLAPGRVGYGAAQLVLAYLFVVIACGVATRALVPITAVLYAWLYFTSQLDSYQHHYLVALVLVIASFVPWQRPDGGTAGTPIRAWAVRLLLVQLAIMYLWAAIAKLDGAWLDGSTLARQLTGDLGALVRGTIGFPVAAVLVVLAELGLAATVWSRRTWAIAAPLGVAFHLGILATGLEIGLFAFLMVAFYVLVVPDRIWVTLAARLPGAGAWRARGSWAVWAASLVAAIGLAWLVRVEHAVGVALVVAAVPLVLAGRALRGRRAPAVAIGLAHAAAIALWLLVDRTTTVAVDYYRFWGGSQRRLGDLATAERAYRGLVAIAPDQEVGHYQLGRLLMRGDRPDEALPHLHAAQRLAPGNARGFVEEARYLQRRGDTAGALAKARQATAADPAHAGARALLDSLSGATAPHPTPHPPPTDDPE